VSRPHRIGRSGPARRQRDPERWTGGHRPEGAGAGDPEAGFVGGFEGLLFGLLLFVVGTLLAAAAWAVVDTKFAVDTAARQAVRTYVEAPDAALAGPQSEEAAVDALAGYGRRATAADVRLVGGSFVRCDRVTIEVTQRSPLLVLPWLGQVGTGQVVSARHSELVDPFRTGLPGTSTCA
jgi:hypothetical protein